MILRNELPHERGIVIPISKNIADQIRLVPFCLIVITKTISTPHYIKILSNIQRNTHLRAHIIILIILVIKIQRQSNESNVAHTGTSNIDGNIAVEDLLRSQFLSDS